MPAESDFAQWLQDELDKRGWRQADLVRKSGLSSGYISQILNREKLPKYNACLSIATALNITEGQVLERAGLVSPSYDRDEIETKQLLADFYSLPEHDRQVILDQMRALRRLREEQATYETRS